MFAHLHEKVKALLQRKERARQEKQRRWYVKNAARIAAKYSAKAPERRLPQKQVTCATCGDTFTTAKRVQRFCKKQCRWKWRHVA